MALNPSGGMWTTWMSFTREKVDCTYLAEIHKYSANAASYRIEAVRRSIEHGSNAQVCTSTEFLPMWPSMPCTKLHSIQIGTLLKRTNRYIAWQPTCHQASGSLLLEKGLFRGYRSHKP